MKWSAPGDPTAEKTANKDQANGYAGLDSGGKLKTSELPSSVVTASSVPRNVRSIHWCWACVPRRSSSSSRAERVDTASALEISYDQTAKLVANLNASHLVAPSPARVGTCGRC